ncbi:DUF2312 domain-containing protein [Fodinicurvata sediminis]|uniref:DUF2312 domain-containing protein n=1 Tax=Fodinicurvata sediminis TaxID=1121832 RepID=UPI0003B5C629|nr:DUF2312 domain-containing protein [Fodinicurvata sediminis]
MSGPGHNINAGGIAGDRLRSFIERVERLEEERAALDADKKEVYAEAKSEGWDTKIMKKLIQRRRMDQSDREEQDMLLDLYEQAIQGGGANAHVQAHAPAPEDAPPADDSEVGFLGGG